MMNVRPRALLFAVLVASSRLHARRAGKAILPRSAALTLDEAVQLALKHNHVVRIAGYKDRRKGAREGRLRAAPISPFSGTTAMC